MATAARLDIGASRNVKVSAFLDARPSFKDGGAVRNVDASAFLNGGASPNDGRVSFRDGGPSANVEGLAFLDGGVAWKDGGVECALERLEQEIRYSDYPRPPP
jgi:hypothetical protein